MEPVLLVLAVLLCAAGAGVSTYYLNASRETFWFWGRKAEDLYMQVESLDCELSTFFETNYSFVEGTPQVHDQEGLRKAAEHMATTKMLVGFYFPRLMPTLARVIVAAGTAHRALKNAQKSQTDKERLLVSVDTAVCELKDALEELKTVVLKEGRQANAKKAFALFRRPAKATAGVGRVLQVPA
jgi:hypothetical protein